MSTTSRYIIKVQTTNGDFYVTDYYQNKSIIRFNLTNNIKNAQNFHGKSISGPGINDISKDTYGNPPNYTPSATIYAAIKNKDWFIQHISMFFDINNNLLYEEPGKKKTKNFHGIKNKKVDFNFN